MKKRRGPLFSSTRDEKRWRLGKRAGILSPLPYNDRSPDYELGVHDLVSDDYGIDAIQDLEDQ